MLARRVRVAFVEIVRAGIVIISIAAASALLLFVGGYHVTAGLEALWYGSFGSWYAFTSATLVRAVPLMLTGTAVAVAFRAGVFNIGAEGQLLAGAASATTIALAPPLAHAPPFVVMMLALAAAALAGAAWAGIAAQLRTRFGVLEVISTIMLNFVALYGVSYLVRGPLQEPTHIYPQSPTLGDALHLQRIAGAGRLHVGLILAVVSTLVSGWIFRHSAAGFRLIAVGESPAAASSAGQIDVARTASRAFMSSGALAGLAGGVEVLGVTFALYENVSPGYGYTAIAVALLATLDPWRVTLTAVLFGALEAGAGAMQRDAAIPSSLVSVIEALLILVVVAVQAIRVRQVRVRVVAPIDQSTV
jgi:general nucleoside transport system permease protein